MKSFIYRAAAAVNTLPDWLWVLLAMGMCYALVRD
jgi:hypothetical protein